MRQKYIMQAFFAITLTRISKSICVDNFNEVNNSFIWMKCCNQGSHKMDGAGIFEIINGETVRKWHALFRVE